MAVIEEGDVDCSVVGGCEVEPISTTLENGLDKQVVVLFMLKELAVRCSLSKRIMAFCLD